MKQRLKSPFLVTVASGAVVLAGCSSPEDSSTPVVDDAASDVADVFVNTCPPTEPVAGSVCTGDPSSTPSTFNHGCDFSHSCGTPPIHDALYVCQDGRWTRTHSNGCNPPGPTTYDGGPDTMDVSVVDGADGDVADETMDAALD